MVRRESEREEEVGEPVRPGEERGVDRLRGAQAHELTLGAAGDRASDVQGGRGRRPPREDEAGERGMLRVEPIDLSLEPVDVRLADGRHALRRAGGTRELGLRDEELVAEALEELPFVGERLGELAQGEAEPGPELVVGAVGADAERVLRYARTTVETGGTAIPRAGVETRDVLASGRPGSSSKGELSPWTGQNEMWRTSLCFAS